MTENLTAIVVDDDPFIPGLMKAILKTEGIETHLAKNKAGAIKLLNDHPEAHLLITDWNLPDGNGGHIVDHVRGTLENHKIHILGISGKAGNKDDPEEMQQYIAAHNRKYGNEPGMHFLPKPFGFNEVTNKLREMKFLRG